MVIKLGKKRQGLPIPEASRFDRMSTGDLSLALEADLMSAGHIFQTYQQRLGEPEAALALLQDHLDSAMAMTKALRRKHVVTMPNS